MGTDGKILQTEVNEEEISGRFMSYFFCYLFPTNETVFFPVDRLPLVSTGLEFAEIRGII